MLLKVSSSLISLSLSSSSVCSTTFTGSVCSSCSFSVSLPSTSFPSTTVTSVSVKKKILCTVVVWNYRKSCNKLCTSYPLVVLQPWNFFKPMLKTTITFIFIFSFVCLGSNIFLLPFYPRFSIWGERYWPSGHYWIFVLDRTR